MQRFYSIFFICIVTMVSGQSGQLPSNQYSQVDQALEAAVNHVAGIAGYAKVGEYDQKGIKVANARSDGIQLDLTFNDVQGPLRNTILAVGIIPLAQGNGFCRFLVRLNVTSNKLTL